LSSFERFEFNGIGIINWTLYIYNVCINHICLISTFMIHHPWTGKEAYWQTDKSSRQSGSWDISLLKLFQHFHKKKWDPAKHFFVWVQIVYNLSFLHSIILWKNILLWIGLYRILIFRIGFMSLFHMHSWSEEYFTHIILSQDAAITPTPSSVSGIRPDTR